MMMKRPLHTRRTQALSLAFMLALMAAGAADAKLLGGGKKHKNTPTVGKRIDILTQETSSLPDPTLATTEVSLPPEQLNTTWSQPGGNANKVMGHLALGAHLNIVWHKNISGNSHSIRLAAAPVVADNRLYVIDTDARIYAYNAQTGDALWSADFSTTDYRRTVYGGGVSVENGMVFATNGRGDVGALNAKTGALLWKRRPSGPLRGAPATAGGALYIMTQDSQLIALNQQDGKSLWPAPATSALEFAGVFGVAAPAIAQGTVVGGFSSGDLNAYRYENGRTVWSDTLSRTSMATSVASISDIDANPVIDRGRVIAIGAGGRMVAENLNTGQREWEANMSGLQMPWVAGEWIYVVTQDGKLNCVTRGTGKIRWTLLLPKTKHNKLDGTPIQWAGPVLAGNRLILVSSTGLMAQVNPHTGDLIEMSGATGPSSLAPIVVNNMMFTLDDSGRLAAWR